MSVCNPYTEASNLKSVAGYGAGQQLTGSSTLVKATEDSELSSRGAS